VELVGGKLMADVVVEHELAPVNELTVSGKHNFVRQSERGRLEGLDGSLVAVLEVVGDAISEGLEEYTEVLELVFFVAVLAREVYVLRMMEHICQVRNYLMEVLSMYHQRDCLLYCVSPAVVRY
jgi:hypothetical protein